MGMNVYVNLDDLTSAMQFVKLNSQSSSHDLGDGEFHLEVSLTVTHRATGVQVVGDLEFGSPTVVRFGRSAQDRIIQICTAVGIPFRFH